MAESLSESPPQQGPMCPVCFRDYSDSEAKLIPRILQCGHTYCTECLERLLNMELEDDEDQTMIFNIHYAGRRWTTTRRFPSIFNPPRPPKNDIKCPTCKMENRIENRDISTLTKNFALLGLRTQSSVSLHPKKSHYCKDHDHEKRIYCRDCKKLVCAYCQLYGDHRGHHCEIATDAAKPSVELLKEAKDKLMKDFNDVTQGETAVNTAIVKLERNRERCERKVKRYFNRFIGRLRRKRDDLLLDIGSWTDDQMFVLDAQLKSLSNAIKDSESIQANCQSLIEGDPLEALTQEDEILREVDDIKQRVAGLSFQPLINPWIRCKLTRSEYDDSIDEVLDSCKLKFDTDILHKKGAALNYSADEEPVSDSDSESSVLDDDDKDLSDSDLVGGQEGDQSHMSFQDHTSSRVSHDGGGSSGGGGAVGGASVGGFREDFDDQKKRERERAAARFLHSQEVGGGGASLMPKLELADPSGLRSRWGYHPSSSSSLGVRHSLPALSSNQASGGGASLNAGIRPSGSTPNNTPLHGDTNPVSPAQASKGSTSYLFNSNPNTQYNRQRSLADQLQQVMETLSRTTTNLSDEEEEDEEDDAEESRHRLHLVENLSPPFDLHDTYGHMLALDVRNRDNSLSSSSHEASFHIDDLEEGSSSPNAYPGPSYVTMSVLDSVEVIRRSRLLRERTGERSPLDSDEELENTTADPSYLDSIMSSTGHTSSPNVTRRSMSNSDTPSRSPLQTTDQEETDFAFGHHLSLPVDSNGQQTEVVFPRHYSWTADHGEAVGVPGGGANREAAGGRERDERGGEGRGRGGRGLRLRLEGNSTTLQMSMDSPDVNVLNASNEIEEEDTACGNKEDRVECDS